MNSKIINWGKKNLFNSWFNTLITILLGFFLTKALVVFIGWFFSVSWQVIPRNLKLILVGSYPVEQLWRIWFLLLLALVLTGLTFSLREKGIRSLGLSLMAGPALLALVPFAPFNRIALLVLSAGFGLSYIIGRKVLKRSALMWIGLAWFLLLPLIYIMVGGVTAKGGWLPVVRTNRWGGLLLSMIISITSILLSFVLGLLLALGRRSKFPVISIFCVGVIEIIRGVPLITLLFLGYLILPLALPSYMTLGVLMRAMAGIVLFHSAYMAENIRGGFQGLSRTQYEAAYAMNFNPLQSMFLIILPQVIKNIIPVLVNGFTGMIKDTSLISIIGLLDLVGISTAIAANPEFMSDSQQVLLFLSFIYFILCFSISRTSRKIEASMDHDN